MLTDTALRNLKPKSKIYKASDRDGMYVTVSPTGTVTFRYDYRLNGRRETLTIGRYGPAGISLALAREKLIDAKRAVTQGKSPALEKQRDKRRLTAAKTFGDVADKWMADARMADSTKAMRKHIVDRDILPVFQNRQLNEITADDLRALCNKVKARGAPATAVHVRDIVKQVFIFAILHGEKVDNPADDVGAASIATFVPKDQTAFTLQRAFGGYSVFGDLDEDISFSDVVELPEIIVTTPERCLMLQSLQPEAFKDVGLVMFDECHLLHPREADRSRRSIDSMLCLLNLTHSAPDADLLLISAMMQNAEEIAGWVAELTGRPCLSLDLAWKPTRQARGCVAYSSGRISELEEMLRAEHAVATTKSVPAKLKSKLSAQPLAFFCLRQTWATRKRSDYALMALLDEPIEFATGTNKWTKGWYLTPNGNKVAGTIAAAAAEDGLKTLTFVQSTVAAESTVRHFRELLPKRRVPLTDEEKAWRKLVEEELGGPQYCYLKLDAKGRVEGSAASHHARLIKHERLLHESLFKRRDGINALFATSTLAQGMNLPSDIVLTRDISA